jgi:ABC-type sulfate/molybdate transport systems ATPase subunit
MPRRDEGLVLRDVSARAGSFRLARVTLDIERGRTLVLLGPSGAGKSTLVHTIAGFRKVDAGQVVLASTEVTKLPPERRRVGMVFQDDALFPHLSVIDNIRFGPRAQRRDVSSGAIDELVGSLGLKPLLNRSPRSLSGGERQRVALARALAAEPHVLLLDEPLSALDQPTREELREVVRAQARRAFLPTMYITHDRDEALSLADDLAVIVAGELRQNGPADVVVAEPADIDVARLLGWRLLGSAQIRQGRCELGGLQLPSPSHAPEGASVTVVYRPEEVHLQRDQGPLEAALQGTVSAIHPTRPLAQVEIASSPPIHALALQSTLRHLDLVAGAPVAAQLPPGAVRVIVR